jgi:hypothetical protein
MIPRTLAHLARATGARLLDAAGAPAGPGLGGGGRRRRRPGRHRLARVPAWQPLCGPHRRARRRACLHRRGRPVGCGRRAHLPADRRRSAPGRRRRPDRLRSAGPGRARRGPPRHRHRDHRLVRQDLDQGPARPGARDRRRDRGAGGLLQRRDRRAAHRLPGHPDHAVPRRRDGGPGDRPHRLSHPDRTPSDRRRAQRRVRPRRGVRRPRQHRPSQG